MTRAHFKLHDYRSANGNDERPSVVHVPALSVSCCESFTATTARVHGDVAVSTWVKLSRRTNQPKRHGGEKTGRSVRPTGCV